MTGNRKIIHCLRAPVGGLYRHVRDLVTAQSDSGNPVGIICDAVTGGDAAEKSLGAIAEKCALGVMRVPMSRWIGPRDISACRAVRRFARDTQAEVVHGHGAKGGAYARLAVASLRRAGRGAVAVYTPHGGSLHYERDTLAGRIFLALERRLAPRSHGLIFESRYSAELYEQKVGPFPCIRFIVHNGLWPHEFYETALDVDAADFLFVGELRHLKGVDVLLTALPDVKPGRGVTAVIVGSGPDEAKFRRLAAEPALRDRVTFAGPMPASRAFTRARCLVVASRAESFPYIVLEAAAARIPMILTNVGGIPEITAGSAMELVPPGDPVALKTQMDAFLDDPSEFTARAKTLQSIVSERYRVSGMAEAISLCYERVIALAAIGK